MLSDLIENYAEQFRRASEEQRYGDTIKLLEEMKGRLKAQPPVASEVVRYLKSIASEGPRPDTQFAFLAAWSNLSPEYCEPLCQIVQSERCQASHEPAIELLTEVGDVRAISSLSKALQYRWDFDTWFHIPRKALQALKAIGTPEALSIVDSARKSPESAIREEAELLLADDEPI